MYTYLQGNFQCVKCGANSSACIHTYLFQTDLKNHSHTYCVGDSEVIDGFDDFVPLLPWNESSSLIVAVGDWDCYQCHLAWQWATLTLNVQKTKSGAHLGTIASLSTLVPWDPTALDGVHLVEPELAFFSGLWPIKDSNRMEVGLTRWLSLPVAKRCKLVVKGYQEWCREVAGIEKPFNPFENTPLSPSGGAG